MSGGIGNPLPGPSKKQALNDEPPVKDEHPSTKKQLKNLTAKKGKLPGHYGGDFTLEERITTLETAVLALGADVEEFGDTPGHPFHGNQWTGGGGGSDPSVSSEKNARMAEQERFLRGEDENPAVDKAFEQGISLSPARVRELDETYGVTARGIGAASVPLDIAGEEGLDGSPGDAAQQLAEDHGLSAVKVSNSGPSGWPIYQFEGKANNIFTMLDRYEGGS